MEFRPARRVAGPLIGAAMALTVLASGCTRPGAYPVSGVVTYNKQPLNEAQVTFVATIDLNAAKVYATTDKQGRFAMSFGALPGNYKVAVRQSRPIDVNHPSQFLAMDPLELYGDPKKSPLTADVTKDASRNHFTFDLTGPPR